MPRPPIHPGEILAEELAETAVTPTELARQLKVPGNRITQIIQGKRAISGDTALRMDIRFGTSAQFWFNLQTPTISAWPLGRQVRRSRGCRCALREQGQRRDGEAAVDRGDDSCYDHGRSCTNGAVAVGWAAGCASARALDHKKDVARGPVGKSGGLRAGIEAYSRSRTPGKSDQYPGVLDLTCQ